MNPGVIHTVNHLNAFGQLFLEGSFKVDALDERADTDFFIFKYLVPPLLAFWKTILSHIQTKLIDMLFRNVDACPPVT